jgi:hypothetical protein
MWSNDKIINYILKEELKMDSISVRTINKYSTEVIISDKRIVLTDMDKVEADKEKKRKIFNGILYTISIIIYVVFVAWFSYMFVCHDYGHYEAEFINEDGVMIDIDGDGDYYDWVEPRN